MSQNLAASEFEPSANVIELPLERVRETVPEAISASIEIRSKSAKELADEYGVSDRTVNTWFKVVAAAYCWIDLETLKTGKSAKTRYTPLFQTLLADYRADAANRSDQDWIAAVHAANPDKLPAAPAAPKSASGEDVPLSQTEVLPRDGELQSKTSDRDSAMRSRAAASDRPDEVVGYERSVTLDRLINGRLAPQAPQSPEQNSVFLQVQERLNRLQQQREQTRNQIQHTAQSHMDTATALEVMEDIELIERVRAKAQRHFQLEQDVYREELDLLKTQTVLGK